MVGWHHRLNGQSLSKLWEAVKPGVLQSVGSQRVGSNLYMEQQREVEIPEAVHYV